MPLHITLEDGSPFTLDGMVVRPDRPGRFPLVLLTHGEPYDFSETSAWMPTILLRPAVAFAQRGYAAVMFLRRGFGGSQGPYAEGHGPCGARDYLRATRASAEDVLGVLSVLRNEEWVDPQRVLLVGQSSGGVAVTAAAGQHPSGIIGILNFAGGRGSMTTTALCQPELVFDMWRTLGRSVRVPSLWIFAENDQYFAPTIARAMFDAYRSGGAPAEFIVAPPFGADGHLLLYLAAPPVWWPLVSPFLDAMHLPTRIVVDLPPTREQPQRE
ncbi:MAG TPA: alpha/beta hydrolase [Burkholderiales bacterium]|nr:alpha/beta hydrolase [Burkholderiales bacterium]